MSQCCEEVWQLLRLVGSVGVHLDNNVVTRIQCAGEASEIGRAEALLGPSMHHLDIGVIGCNGIRESSGAIG